MRRVLQSSFWGTMSLWVCLNAGWTGLAQTPAATGGPLTSARASAAPGPVISLLKQKCLPCHGEGEKGLKGGLDLRSRAAMLKGGESGLPALVPGKPEQSPVYMAVTWRDPGLQMPPKENDRLAPEQVEMIRTWIASGAAWPEDLHAAAGAAVPTWTDQKSTRGVAVKTSGGLSPDWTHRAYQPEDLWAYQPIQRPAIPKPSDSESRIRNPIDAFILEKLAERSLQFAPEANKLALARRTAVDLTGLPPAPEEIDAFLQDDSPLAFERLVSRLLNSPHYGEQQARHWLDVARYADTSGFSNDYERPNAWRYRDYVIRAFNEDKPYDRFILEQIAGDELDPSDPELMIAVGYLRMGPWEHTGMTVATVTRQQYLDDVTHQVGVSFLGQGLRCASCHDHKFDPVPTRDYYRMQAVFASTQFAERSVPFLQEETFQGDAKARAVIERRLDEAKDKLAWFGQKNKEAIEARLKKEGLKNFEDLPREGRPNRAEFGLTREELTLRKIYQKRRDYYERELLRFEPYAFSVYSGPHNRYLSNRALHPLPENRDGTIPVVHILSGGSLESPLEPVPPGVLSAMSGWNDLDLPSAQRLIPESMEGRRLALAKWIAHPRNTLTARVIVNRIWQQHFGRGLVATPNNFGKMGARPTHPELLDWLASWFMDNGWSLKELHRLILHSATYGQSSRPALPPQSQDRQETPADLPPRGNASEVDPQNTLLWHFPARRLTAEEIRDGLLAATGELNRQMGGPGVYPEINWEVALQPRHIMGSVAPPYQPSLTPAERNRRTIYAFRIRTLPDPMLEVFNRPGSEVSCERRDETTVTPQAFALFNSTAMHDRALALAARIERESNGLLGQIRRAFRLCYGREPEMAEMELCSAHVERMTLHHREHPPVPTELPRTVQQHMVEEMTGETMHWEDRLDGLDHYKRDLKPWDVGPRTRALADFCLVLMNSNEFLYLR